jgi:hypothetical protein
MTVVANGYDTGDVKTQDDLDEGVTVYGPIYIHNHTGSSGTFTVTETASTTNGWSIGGQYGYGGMIGVEAGVSLAAKVKAEAHVDISIQGELNGSGTHSWSVGDTYTKQPCHCYKFRAWCAKRTIAYERTARSDRWRCDNGNCQYCGWMIEYMDTINGSATGDEDHNQGAENVYTWGQTTDECLECYGVTRTCPGDI